MAVTRLSEYQAQGSTVDELRSFLESIVPIILSSDGCRSCQLLQGHDHPTRFMMIEVWESIEAHQASVKSISPEALARVKELLSGPPTGEYFDP